MIEIVITVCLLFLAPNGDVACRCEEQIIQQKKPKISRPVKEIPRLAIQSTQNRGVRR